MINYKKIYYVVKPHGKVFEIVYSHLYQLFLNNGCDCEMRMLKQSMHVEKLVTWKYMRSALIGSLLAIARMRLRQDRAFLQARPRRS